eukprot:3110932-Pyramimonas_sp.AAC.1
MVMVINGGDDDDGYDCDDDDNDACTMIVVMMVVIVMSVPANVGDDNDCDIDGDEKWCEFDDDGDDADE